MALESSGTILYVANISLYRITGLEIVTGGPKFYTHTQKHERARAHTHTHRHTHTDTDTDTHTQTHTQIHKHTEAHFISLVFLRKCRNKTKKNTVIEYGYRIWYLIFSEEYLYLRTLAV